MVSKYTIAAVPINDSRNTLERYAQVIPIPVKIPYTFADAEAMAKKYNENSTLRSILKNYKLSHFVPFNLEALTMDPPPYYLGVDYA